ncbi:MAG: M55 family metallopeptidase, partial [Armatimonadota bacterium]|nr:M55 family metallopeptidase [Armatimonadota bacterium]
MTITVCHRSRATILRGEEAMRVMIWVDAEGISGVTSWEQVLAGRSRYDEGRRLMTQEVNAAVR